MDNLYLPMNIKKGISSRERVNSELQKASSVNSSNKSWGNIDCKIIKSLID